MRINELIVNINKLSFTNDNILKIFEDVKISNNNKSSFISKDKEKNTIKQEKNPFFYPENNSLKYDKYLTKISEIGYQYSELGPLGYFNDEVSIIKDFLIKLNIQISGAAHVHNFADLSMFNKLKLDNNF